MPEVAGNRSENVSDRIDTRTRVLAARAPGRVDQHGREREQRDSSCEPA